MLLIIASCELDQPVLDALTQERLVDEQPPELVDVLKRSAYQSLMEGGSFGGHNGFWSYQEVTSDELAIPVKGGDWADGYIWVRAHRHTWNIDDDGINGMWEFCFRIVAESNLLMLQFPEIEELVGELKVLRAFAYFLLLDNFGSVPIVLETDIDPSPSSNTPREVFDFIESSVMDNLQFLPETDDKISLNYYAAHMLLAKLYLGAENYIGEARWADAQNAIDVVIEQGPYNLNENFFANFATANSASPENIFTLPYDANNAPNFNLHHMTFHYESQATFDLVDQPWNGYASLEEFYNSFDEDDVRRASLRAGQQFALDGTPLRDDAGFDGDPDGPEIFFTPEINELEPNAFRQAGTRVNKFEIAVGAQPDLDNDFPVFRLADAFLMKAEAAYRLGDQATATDFVNRIRERAGIAPVASVDADLLLAERGREMFAEGWRRSDLIRFGRFGDAWWEKPASDQSIRRLFPIPLNQVQSNPNLTQNPGY